MWKNFLKWLLKFALEKLGEDVDAEAQQALDEYNRKRGDVEKSHAESEQELERLENERLRLLGLRTKSSHEIEFLQEQVKAQDETLRRLKDEKEQKLTAIRNSDDDTILHGDLPDAS
jgi:hypothetical protein